MEWISVEDRLPKPDQNVMVWVCPHIRFKVEWTARFERFYIEKNIHWFGGWSVEGGYVTHWMEIIPPSTK